MRKVLEREKKNKVNWTIYLTVTILFSNTLGAVNLKRYDVDLTTYVSLDSKSSECRVSYDSLNTFDMTDCLNFKNSKGISIFCTKDKSLCKTHSEVAFFGATGEELDKENISKTPPFIGEKTFNFWGGNGTEESIDIKNKDSVVLESYGEFSSSETFSGTYTKFLEKYFIYKKDTICVLDAECPMQCVKLYDLDDKN